ncbi:unnamed protein product [Urochloa humidicola]
MPLISGRNALLCISRPPPLPASLPDRCSTTRAGSSVMPEAKSSGPPLCPQRSRLKLVQSPLPSPTLAAAADASHRPQGRPLTGYILRPRP